MSDLMARLEILRRLIERASTAFEWCGNTAIQKLVYTLEHVYKIDLGYRFGLHHYGPYSFDLAGDLSLGEQADLWRTTAQPIEGIGGSGFGIMFDVKEAKSTKPEIQRRWEQLAPTLETALEKLGKLKTKDLELVATIHYLQNVQRVPSDQIEEVFRLLKPRFTADDFQRGQKEVAELEASAKAA